MLLEEARDVARSLEYHEETLAQLRDARDEIPETADFRAVGDTNTFSGGYEERIDKLVDRYCDMFDQVLEDLAPAQRDPNIPDPIMMRSMERMETPKFDGTGLDRILT